MSPCQEKWNDLVQQVEDLNLELPFVLRRTGVPKERREKYLTGQACPQIATSMRLSLKVKDIRRRRNTLGIP